MDNNNVSLRGGMQQSARPGLQHAGNLVSSLILLQRDRTYCDVLLQAESSVDEVANEPSTKTASEARGVWAHRAVLAAVSPYFSRTCSSSFKACTMQVLVIRGVKLEILQAMIENIYSATALVVSVEKAKALLAAAALLEVDEVRDAACVCLQHALVVDNALGIRASAASHGCTALAATATQYIKDHFEEVLEASELLSLSPAALAALLDIDRLPAIEDHVLDAVIRWTQYRPQERRRHLPSLMRAVKLSLIPREELVERARNEPLLNAEPRALLEIIEALLTDHVLPVRYTHNSQPPVTLVVIGGLVDDTCSSSVLGCSLPGGTWQCIAALPTPRSRAGAALLDGRIYVVGGDDGTSPVRTVFVYDPETNSWSSGPNMISTRRWLGVTALDGRLYAIGGWVDISNWLRSMLADRYIVGTVYKSAEVLDPREGVWRSIASMAARRYTHGVATLDGKLYAIGGYDNFTRLNSTERYDPVAGKWETVEAMADQRESVAVGVVDDAVYAVGGYDGTTELRTVERTNMSSRAGPQRLVSDALPTGNLQHAYELLVKLAGHRRDATHCDVLLQVESMTSEEVGEQGSEERGVWAHRTVLAASSTYFYTMFYNSIRKSTTQTVILKNINLETLRALVDNIYTASSLSVNVETAVALLAAAMMLKVGEVRDAACACLERALSADNALGIRASALKHGCSALAIAATQYIQRHFGRVIQADEFLALTPASLVDLLDRDVHVASNDSVLVAVLRWTQHLPQERRRHLDSLLLVSREKLEPRKALVQQLRGQLKPRDALAPRKALQAHEMQILREALKPQNMSEPRDALEPRESLKSHSALVPRDAQNPEDTLALRDTLEPQESVDSLDALVKLDSIEPLDTFEPRNAVKPQKSLESYDVSQDAQILREEEALREALQPRVAVESGEVLELHEVLEQRMSLTDGARRAVATVHERTYWSAVRAQGQPQRNTMSHALLLMGGYFDKSVQVYSLPDGQVHTAAMMPARRTCAAAALFNNRVFFVGGGQDYIPDCSVFVYDVVTDSWRTGPPLKTARFWLGMAVLNGRLYAAGGRGARPELDTVEALDPRESMWRTVANMGTRRYQHALAELNGRLYAFGGYESDVPLNSTERYDPTANKWTAVENMAERRGGVGAGVSNNTIYALGGCGVDDNRPFHSMEQYRLGIGWVDAPPLPACRRNATVTVHGSRLYVVGGHDGTNSVNTVLEFDTTTEEWSRMVDLPEFDDIPSAVVITCPSTNRHTNVRHFTTSGIVRRY